MRTTWTMIGGLLVGGLMACGHAPGKANGPVGDDCGCAIDSPANAGTVTLQARVSSGSGPVDLSDQRYWNAVVSFEKGGATGGIEETKNDWDLLFGNDRDSALDRFTVNTVTDDRSFIVDLGELQLRDAPAEVDPLLVPPQQGVGFGDLPSTDVRTRDAVPVVEGHVYWVRTLDDDSRLVTLVGVQRHALNGSVTLAWFRSSEPDRFVFAWPE